MSDSHRDWPVRSPDGHQAKLRIHGPTQAADGLLLVPAMGVAARHYDALASRLAGAGVLVAVHEWRGIGSSSARASRQHDWGYRELLEIDLPASVDAACAGAPGVHWRIGGHSLGAQFAALLAAVDARLQGIFIVASGVPYWRAYPHWQKVLLRGIFGFMNGLGAVSGYFPGRRTGFAGNESRGVIRDWTRTGRVGHYRVPGLSRDYEHALQSTCLPVLALRMAEDRYVPPASLDLLLAKLPRAQIERHELGRAALGGRRADHFGWMKHPGQVASLLIDWIASTNREPTWPSRD